MRHIQDFNSYNESFRSVIAGSALLLSLFANDAKGQETKTKALLSQVDKMTANNIEDSLRKKNFTLIKSGRSFENKFLVSSGSGITAEDALKRAQEDMQNKIEILGRPGAQDIWLYDETNKGYEVLPSSGPRTGNFHVVIITEILNKKIKKHGLYDPELNIYR